MARPTKLDKTLHNKIIKLLKTGVTVTDACSAVGIAKSTFYEWIERGEAGEEIFAEFSDAVTRAHNAAKVTAIDTLHSSLLPSETVSRTREVFTETRINPYGKEYEYKRANERETVTTTPGDWRASIEFLKRRYPDEWSEKLQVTVDINLVIQLVEELNGAGIDATDFFTQAIERARLTRGS